MALLLVPTGMVSALNGTIDDGYGGLEHRASTALIAARRDLPRIAVANAAKGAPPEELTDGYVTLLGLIMGACNVAGAVVGARMAISRGSEFSRPTV